MQAAHRVQEFLISDVLWELIEPLISVRPKPVYPLGCHRQRTPDRSIMNGTFFVLCAGCQWKAFDHAVKSERNVTLGGGENA